MYEIQALDVGTISYVSKIRDQWFRDSDRASSLRDRPLKNTQLVSEHKVNHRDHLPHPSHPNACLVLLVCRQRGRSYRYDAKAIVGAHAVDFRPFLWNREGIERRLGDEVREVTSDRQVSGR